MKRVLIITQYFYPEGFKSNDMAVELVRRGYKVDVLAGIPNYPQGKYFKGYGLFSKRKEIWNGVTIYRAFQTPRGKKASGVGLSINYLTYMFCSTFWVLFFFVWKRYDCVIVHEPSPITQACAAVVLKKIKKIAFYPWIMDIWPDAMSSGGGIKNQQVLSVMTRFVQWVYNNSTKILITSKGFEELILRQGNYKDKLIYFPNWSDDVMAMPIREVPQLPRDGFNIMMAGNLGSAQTIDKVMEAANLLKHRKDVRWIFVGDGSEKDYIEKYREKYHLEDTVYVMGRYPSNCMSAFYKQADAMLLTLKAKFPHLKAVVPARLQNYMSSGNPIIGMVDGGSAEIIRESNCGYVVPAEDYKALAELIEHKILLDVDNFKRKGINGRKYFEREFTIEKCISHLENIINNG